MPPSHPIADSEPVGYLFHNEYGAVLYSISDDATEGFSLIGPIYSVPQPAPVVQCPFPCGWDNLNKLAVQDAAFVARGLIEGEPATEAQRQAIILNNDRLLKVISACRAAMLNGGKS